MAATRGLGWGGTSVKALSSLISGEVDSGTL